MILQQPLMLSALLVLLPLAKLMIRAHRLRETAAATLRGPRPASRAWKHRIARRLTGVGLLILALARPGWNPHPGPPGEQGRDLVIALDISRSMLAADVFPTRLDAARIALHEALPHMIGLRLGLIQFAGAASIRVPLTRDHDFVRYMLERAAPSDADVGSTSLQSAIEKAVDVVLKESDRGQQDLIIFTDGEDHISDIDATTETLRACGARVLIIGLGDPVAGARVPRDEGTNAWMRFDDQDVISRLDEETLVALSREIPGVTYHAAGTRPFDLMTLYREVMVTTQGVSSADTRHLVYTEGYPFLIALALLLFFCPVPRGRLPLVATIMMLGCSRANQIPSSEYAQRLEAGLQQWSEAQAHVATDKAAAYAMLQDARESFLLAALHAPGDVEAAQQIAGVTAQIRMVESALKQQAREEQDLQQRIQEAIKQLKALTAREQTVAHQGQTLLRRRPKPTPEQMAAAAPPMRTEQSAIHAGTKAVLQTISEVRGIIQAALSAAFRDSEVPRDTPPETEFDGAIVCLTSARNAQSEALHGLSPDALDWPHANAGMLTAQRQMQEALRQLSDQGQGEQQDTDSEFDEDMMDEWDDDMEWSESDAQSPQSIPMNSQRFKTALENRSLPSPNYTAEEILMQEAANQEKRARQKAASAGAKVEKNW